MIALCALILAALNYNMINAAREIATLLAFVIVTRIGRASL